jgi:hypothetical protein
LIKTLDDASNPSAFSRRTKNHFDTHVTGDFFNRLLSCSGRGRAVGSLFSEVDLEARGDHPLRAIRGIVNSALAALGGDF